MKLNLGRHPFSECWDGVYYKVLSDYPRITQEEYAAVLSYLYLLELDNGYTQDFSAATAEYIPDFDLEGL